MYFVEAREYEGSRGALRIRKKLRDGQRGERKLYGAVLVVRRSRGSLPRRDDYLMDEPRRNHVERRAFHMNLVTWRFRRFVNYDETTTPFPSGRADPTLVDHEGDRFLDDHQ